MANNNGEVMLEYYLDNLNNLYLCAINTESEDNNVFTDDEMLQLPTVISFESGTETQTYTKYHIWNHAFYGQQNSNLHVVRIFDNVKSIGDYAFSRSSIYCLQIYAFLPPSFSPKAFDRAPTYADSGEPFKVVCCKGLYSIFAKSLEKFIIEGKIQLEENNTILEQRDLIPALDHAGEGIEEVIYTAKPSTMEDMVYLGHYFDKYNQGRFITSVQFVGLSTSELTNDNYFVEANKWGEVDTLPLNHNYIVSKVQNQEGYLVKGGGAPIPTIARENNTFEIQRSINKNTFSNGAWSENNISTVNDAQELRVILAGNTIKELALQNAYQINGSTERVDYIDVLLDNFAAIKYIAPNAFFGLPVRSINIIGDFDIDSPDKQAQYTGEYYLFKYDAGAWSVQTKAVDSSKRLPQSTVLLKKRYRLDNATFDGYDIVWASKFLTLAAINALLADTQLKIRSIPPYCFARALSNLPAASNETYSNAALVIPAHVKRIGAHAFDGCTQFNSVTIQKRGFALDIEDYAFYNERLLKKVNNYKTSKAEFLALTTVDVNNTVVQKAIMCTKLLLQAFGKNVSSISSDFLVSARREAILQQADLLVQKVGLLSFEYEDNREQIKDSGFIYGTL